MNTCSSNNTGGVVARLERLRLRQMEQTIAAHLMQKYGPLLDSKALAETLKFPTVDALERSFERGHLQIATRDLPHRRGKFALAHQVARYLVEEADDRNCQVNAEPDDLGKERPS